MIAASDPQEFVPSGRQQTLKHPGPHQLSPKVIADKCDDLLLDKFEKVSLKEKKDAEWWIMRKTPVGLFKANAPTATQNDLNKSCFYHNPLKSSSANEHFESFSEYRSFENSHKGHDALSRSCCCGDNCSKYERHFMEDELYVRGHTAVWSRGLNDSENIDNGRITVCAYTSSLPIKNAIWCTFHCEHPTYETELFPSDKKVKEFAGESVPSICIIDSHNIRVFTEKGEDYVTAIPFQIDKIWSMKYGIFLEKEDERHKTTYIENTASLYSLAFPLDEVCPVAINNGTQIQLLNNNNLKVVYTNEEPSICMIFDSQTRQHSVYNVRKLTNAEKMDFLNRGNSTCPSAASLSNKLKSRLSMWECVKNSNYLPIPSPMNSGPGSSISFYNQAHHSKSHSSMATMSRCQSPASSSIGSSWLQRATRLNSSIPCGIGSTCAPSSCSFFDNSKIMSYLHATPIVCLDHLWTDCTTFHDDTMSGAASKVFLYQDVTDQWYLCYILPVQLQLCLVQVDFSNGFRFGSVTSISAKDAVPVPMAHVLAVLEHNGNVTLYSGVTPVGKLHISGTLVQHTPSPYVRRNLAHFQSPFPRRSSLLPHCKQADPKFDDHLLSPVLPETNNARLTNVLPLTFQVESNLAKAVLNGLRDPIGNRITLRYSDGTYYRITLPPLSTHPLIENCIVALKQCLNHELISTILVKWYAARNALGNQDMNLEKEWDSFQNLLFGLLGFAVQDVGSKDDCPVTPSSNPKRQRHSSCGTDDDWLYLLNSVHHTKVWEDVREMLHLKDAKNAFTPELPDLIHAHANSALLPYAKLIHYSFHLIYEDLKLNVLRSEDLKCLVGFLSKLAGQLQLVQYLEHYWYDFPDICKINASSSGNVLHGAILNDYQFVTEKPPNLMGFIHNLMQGSDLGSYPFMKHVNVRSKDIIQIITVILKEVHPHLYEGSVIKLFDPNAPLAENVAVEELLVADSKATEQAVLMMTTKRITVRDLDTLPPAIYLLMYSTLWKCRTDPPADLPAEAYYLLWRDDLAVQARKIELERSGLVSEKNSVYPTQLQGIPTSKAVDNDQQDGMEDIDNPLMKLRFPDDMRVVEARKMLQSSKPVPIVLEQQPDVSDHDFIEEQEKHLYAICTRTMALSPGRGMFTLRTSTPVTTEPLQTPQLCLAGKAPPRGTTVELNHIDTPSNMNLWPLFHNGVANGLRITPDAHNIDNTWIIFNKPKGSIEQQMEHAGFLMALGLNGHLKNLHFLQTYDYLSELHEMTSIGILLGLSATFRGTSDLRMTKTLSIHVEALLPPTSMELDVRQNVQVAGLLGIGLVYQGTSHRHITEVLLSEIGRPPGPEMENSIDRESYSLAAGLSLGLVTLKQGSCSLGLSDLNIPDTLHYYMVGGNRRPLTGAQKDKYKVASFQIREGSSVNLDVTAPGATIALGLMYLGSGNKAVADWMAPPETQYLLDFVRPDFLMFRILSRALILWEEIEPSKEWVEHQVPDTIRPYCMIKPSPNCDVDYEAMNQAYCNIVTGACFALGLKYAGSADEDAFQTLLQFCYMFTNLTSKSIAELAGKPTVETCLNVLILSTAMVMAGSGNLDVIRLVRHLRRRVGVASSAVVTYGSHLALHMALGLLFLGGGRYTLSNSPANVAALICAFYPKFPTHSNDNRYHLQAFRHLYVLAVEPRLVIPKDVHSGKICYASLKVVKIDGTSSFVKGPGIIPDLDTLQKVSVDDERYWPVVFKRGQNWDSLMAILSTNGFVEVKQRAGCLSYVVDKLGYHSQLARTLTQSEAIPWDPPAASIVSFTHDKAVKIFCDHFLSSENKQATPQELKMMQMLNKVTYDAVVKDKLIILPVVSFILKVISEMKTRPCATDLWQIKLITAQTLESRLSTNLVSPQFILAMEQQITELLEHFERELVNPLRNYLTGTEFSLNSTMSRKLAAFVIFYDISFGANCSGDDFLQSIIRDKHSIRALDKIVKILS